MCKIKNFIMFDLIQSINIKHKHFGDAHPHDFPLAKSPQPG